jgi:hypothetical protein
MKIQSLLTALVTASLLVSCASQPSRPLSKNEQFERQVSKYRERKTHLEESDGSRLISRDSLDRGGSAAGDASSLRLSLGQLDGGGQFLATFYLRDGEPKVYVSRQIASSAPDNSYLNRLMANTYGERYGRIAPVYAFRGGHTPRGLNGTETIQYVGSGEEVRWAMAYFLKNIPARG